MRIFALLLVLCSTPAMPGTVYKWVDAQGIVTLSETPPLDPRVSVEEITLQTAPLTSPGQTSGARRQSLLDAAREVDARLAAREERRRKLTEEVNQAQQALAAAERNLEEGRTALPGERRPNQTTGGAIFHDSYYRRIAKLEAAVEEARSKLEEKQRELRNL
jgi:chromosome segregation ATPase